LYHAHEWEDSVEETRNGEVETVVEIERRGREATRDDLEIEIDADEWGVKKGGAKEDEKGLGKG
jgi:hypothetical protein